MLGKASSPRSSRNDAFALPAVEIREQAAGSSSRVTAVVGRNGVGKSRLLAGIAATFDGLNTGRFHPHSSSLTYYMGASKIEVSADDRDYRVSLDGREIEPSGAPLPRRVIAVTTTPFDKFKLPPRYEALPDAVRDARIYRYLGLRDSSGRASATATVYRALNEVFAATEKDASARSRVAAVFAFLGYAPSMRVTYRWSLRGRRLLDSMSGGEELPPLTERYLFPQAFLRLAEANPNFAARVRFAMKEAAASSRSGFIDITADLRSGTGHRDLFRTLQLLRRADVVDVESVEIQRVSDGLVLNLREISSGELALVTSFLSVASAIEDDSLLLIDEPEVSLHPEWQEAYLGLMQNAFSSFRGCHFVVATHSPLLLTSMPKEGGNVVWLDADRSTASREISFAGASSDFVLARAYGVVNEGNLYVQQLLVETIRLAADGQSRSEQFVHNVQLLVALLRNSHGLEKVEAVVSDLRTLAGMTDE